MSIKQILFNTDMVRALLAGTKSVTRRLVKGPYYIDDAEASRISGLAIHRGTRMTDGMPYPGQLYHPGDILYVRETFCPFDADHVVNGVKYAYKADATPESEQIRKEYGYKWRPSIHMPREAARIFLRVTGVRAERLQDISADSCAMEGVPLYQGFVWGRDKYYREQFAAVWNKCYAKPRPVKDENGVIDHYESYPWEDIQETRTYRGKPWYVIGNPWVWVIEFKQISWEEAMSRDA